MKQPHLPLVKTCTAQQVLGGEVDHVAEHRSGIQIREEAVSVVKESPSCPPVNLNGRDCAKPGFLTAEIESPSAGEQRDGRQV